jgi:F-type H+-transporting ATPase subunit delta
MSATAIARRYAEALADVTIERGVTEHIKDQLGRFAQMVESSPELREVFASPVFSTADKQRVLDALLERTNPSEFTANLLRTMLRNDRMQHVKEVYEQFERTINERQGVIVASVTTAGPITAVEQERLGDRLRQLTGKKIQFRFDTDPSLIGGMVTRIGSVVYDGSVRTQLNEIKQRMKTGE